MAQKDEEFPSSDLARPWTRSWRRRHGGQDMELEENAQGSRWPWKRGKGRRRPTMAPSFGLPVRAMAASLCLRAALDGSVYPSRLWCGSGRRGGVLASIGEVERVPAAAAAPWSRQKRGALR